MGSSWTFLHTDYMFINILVGLFLWALLIWKDWHLRSRSLFYFHVLVSFFAILSLFFLVLRPSFVEKSNHKSAYVITEGYRTEVLDSLLKNNKQLEKLNYQPNKELGSQGDDFDEIFVLGKGIEPYDLWQWEGLGVNYLNDLVLSGINKLSYPQFLFVGEEFIVSGQYYNSKKSHQLFLLNSTGVKLDSVLLNSNIQDFQLKTEAKVSGKFLYSLEERNSRDSIISSDPLPVVVKEREKIRVLVLNQFPTFETKFLKNYLAEKGHEVVLRIELSKNKYKFEAFNTGYKTINRLSNDLLEDFDLLIIDSVTYANLSKDEKEALFYSIEHGLGLFVQPDFNLFYQLNKDFGFLFKNDGNTELESTLIKTSLERFPFKLNTDVKSQVLHQFRQEEVTFSIPFGLGQVGTSNLVRVYPILLEGNKELYDSYWRNTLEKITRKKSVSEFEPNSAWAYKDYPFYFDLRTKIKNPDVLHKEVDRVPLRQDLNVSTTWRGKTYPTMVGWNQLLLQNDTTGILDFYVLDTSNWRSLRNFETQVRNQHFFNQSKADGKIIDRVKPMNPVWFFVSFLMCMTYLWLTPKLLE